jgi:6-phosphogluconate dehydrogenase (decarboxylating)
MAIAERWLSTHFNRPGFTIFDHDVYVLCSDGDLMEGVSSEAASIAGHLMLSNLCWIYDCNTITIEGHTDLTFTEDVAARFLAYGWNVLHVGDANDVERMAEALQAFREHDSTPTLIIVNSHIGYGAPHKQDTSAAHGEPLGEEEVRLAKRRYGWPEDAHFLIPDGVRAHFDAGVGRRGRAARTAWWESYDAYRVQHPDLAAQLDQMARGEAPRGWDADLPVFPADAKGLASRASSAKALADKGVAYVDCGTSGGIWGLDRGYSMMIGGPPEAVARLDPIFAALAPGFGHIPRTPERDGQPSTAERGYIHAGPTGAGHFVKMVHNGIEYGLMQAYAEGFNILRNKNSEDLPEDERYTLNLAEIAEVWRRGSVIASWLLDLGAAALVKDGQLSDYSGYVQDSGEGRWTVEAAIEEAVPVDVLSTALYARFRSRKDHTFAERMLSAMRFGFGGHIEGAEAIDPMPPSPRP